MYIYHALIDVLSTCMIGLHINLILYTHVQQIY